MESKYTCPNRCSTENVFKRIPANSNINPKAQKRFWENKMTSFFGKCPATILMMLYDIMFDFCW